MWPSAILRWVSATVKGTTVPAACSLSSFSHEPFCKNLGVLLFSLDAEFQKMLAEADSGSAEQLPSEDSPSGLKSPPHLKTVQ